MDGIIVSGTTNSVIFDLNDYAPYLNFRKVLRRKIHFTRIQLEYDHILYLTGENVTYLLDHNGSSNHFKVKSINGVTPTDLNHLWDLIVELLA